MNKKVIILIILLITCFWVGNIEARTYNYNSIEVDIWVNQDSTFDVMETFSKFLPYAIIFGKEKQWAKRFDDFSYQQQSWYYPAMIYSGQGGAPASFKEFSSSFSSFASSLSSTFSSSPGGSGAGGSAGGGGGGGGGGAG